MKGVVAALAVAASLGAVASPASAQTDAGPWIPPECIQHPDVPTCVNYAIDVADRGVQTARQAYETYAERWVCDVHWILEGEECPEV